MSDEASSSDSTPRSWLERLSQAFAAEPQDRRELVELLRAAQQRGLIDADALAMIEGVVQVAEMQVRDVMIPRAQMVVVEQDAPLEEMVKDIIESAHSRFPVIGDNRDEVVGIVLAKDMLAYGFEGHAGRFSIRDVLRPAAFIPESKRLNMLLKEFRSSRNHMAIVVDEYGGVAGLVTIEDVLEQIVGEIEDEHDVDEEGAIKKFSETRYTVKALTPLEDFNAYFGTTFSDEEFDTIAGVVIQRFGRLPRRGETITVDRFRFKVLHADNRRLHLLELTPLDGEPAPGGTD